MGKTIELSAGLEVPVRIQDYMFAKPFMSIKKEVNDGEDPEVVFEEAKREVHNKLIAWEKQILKFYMDNPKAGNRK